MTDNIRLSIGNGFADMSLIEVTAAQYARSHGAAQDQCALLASNARQMADWINRNAYSKSDPGKIVLELDSIAGGVCCTIKDWGAPINPFDSTLNNIPADLAGVDQASKGLRLLNLGHQGKRLCAVFSIEGFVASPTPPEPEDLDSHADHQGLNNHIEIRATQLEDTEGISSLIYSQYKLTYVHEEFYNPQWIAEQIGKGSLLSTVAILNGEVVGHYSLSSTSPRSAYESGVAIVHARCRNAGLIKKMAIATLDRARQAGVMAIVACAVLSHPYSQRAERSLGFRMTGLLIGATPIGFAGSQRRGSLLLSYLPLLNTAQAVSLPVRYRTLLEAAFAEIKIDILASDTAKGLAQIANASAVLVETHHSSVQVITVGRWHGQAREELIAALRNAVYRKRDVVYCDLDLHALSMSELAEMIELLQTYDLFYAGLLAFGRAGHSHLRMQAVLAPIDTVEIDGLVFDTEKARLLAQNVLGDHDQLAKLI